MEKERQIRYYKTSACSQCGVREKCTRNKEGRRITRWVDEHIIDQTQQRVEAHPEIMRLRKELVEHPFGTIKFWMGARHFLMRTLEHVQTEMSLHVLAYNLKRVIRIVGMTTLMAAITP